MSSTILLRYYHTLAYTVGVGHDDTESYVALALVPSDGEPAEENEQWLEQTVTKNQDL